MVQVVEDTAGKIRDLPITDALKGILSAAGTRAEIDRVRVTSGGQCKLGTCTKRTGSTRHDLGKAADLELWRNGRALDFTDAGDRPFFVSFVRAAASLGATGFGAGISYMGPLTIHVGFGAKAVWGAGGQSANAPAWLRSAANEGWSSPGPMSTDSFVVVARSGLKLRSGPGHEFGVISSLPAGTVVNVVERDGPERQWAKVDMEGDGLVDGHLHTSFLSKLETGVLGGDAADGDCAADTGQQGADYGPEAEDGIEHLRRMDPTAGIEDALLGANVLSRRSLFRTGLRFSSDDLAPEFSAKLRKTLSDCADAGVIMVPYTGIRDPWEQARLWRQSRSSATVNQAIARLRSEGATFLASVLEGVGPQPTGPKVTGSLPGFSWHQWGEAVDCYRQIAGDADWTPSKYEKYADIAESNGLTAGGHWTSFKDWPHVQLRAAAGPSAIYSVREIDTAMKERFGN